MDNLSPTARALVDASAARDRAMLAAYEAEGSDREAELYAAFRRADALYHNAARAHRAAKEAWINPDR